MKINNWQALYDSIEIYPRYGKTFAPKPTVAMLNAFESKHGFRLPATYRSYITVFGPGEIFQRMQKASPGCPELGDLWDLSMHHESHRPMDDEVATLPHEAQQRLAHAYFFAMDVEDWIAWDLTEAKDDMGTEYPLYRVTPMLDVELLSPSFQEYVEKLWDVARTPDAEWDEQELGKRLAFSPAATG